MDISAIIKAVLAPHKGQPGSSLIEMKPGDQLSGRVLKISNDGRVLMDLGGNRALAQIGFPVKIGQHLDLQVVTTGSVLHLRAEPAQGEGRALQTLPKIDFSRTMSLNDRSRFIDIIAKLVGKGGATVHSEGLPASIRDAFAQVGNLFGKIPMDRSTEDISRWVKNAVEDRGVLFEKQLADVAAEQAKSDRIDFEKKPPVSPVRVLITRNIKSLLLQIKHHMAQLGAQYPVSDALESNDIRFLRQSLDQLLGRIDQQQERAVASWRDGDTHQGFVHHLELPDQKKPVQLKVYYPRKGEREAETKQHRMALLLDMDALGPVRVDLSMMARQLMIGFFVGSTAVQQLMEHHIQRVESSLAGRFDLLQINVSVSQNKIEQFNRAANSGADTGRINLTV